MREFKEVKLKNGYSVRTIEKSLYVDFRKKYEPKVFPNRFDLNVEEALTASEKEKIDNLALNLSGKHSVRLGFFLGDDMVGWCYGIQSSEEVFKMGTTGILIEHQRKGIYSSFTPILLDFLKEEGYQSVVSRHYATDNQIIIPKLKCGFVISGMEITDKFGMLVTLSYVFNPVRRKAMDVRSGFSQATPEIKNIIRKY